MIKVDNINKTYDKKVVSELSFKISKPTIFGFLGTNGAGKTTSIRMILGIIKKDSGTVELNTEKIGYLPEERGLYPKTTVYSQLMYFSSLRGLTKEEAEESIDYWLKELHMQHYKHTKAEKLSKGNNQKLQFILSVINDPDIIFLDEPFSGLDPVNAELIKKVLLNFKKMGKIIILSTHEMNRADDLIEEVLIMHEGEVKLKGNLEEIKNSYPVKEIILKTDDDIKELIKKYSYNKEGNTYYIEYDANLINMLTKNNINIIKYEIKRPTLNEIFIEVVK